MRRGLADKVCRQWEGRSRLEPLDDNLRICGQGLLGNARDSSYRDLQNHLRLFRIRAFSLRRDYCQDELAFYRVLLKLGFRRI